MRKGDGMRGQFGGKGVLWVLFSLAEHKKPPNTSQQVLVAVKSENRGPRSDERVCLGLWNPTKDRVGVWKPKVAGCTAREIPPLKVNLQSDGQMAKAYCWMHGIWRLKGWLECWGCKEPGFNFDICLKLGLRNTCQCEMVKEPWSYITLEEGHSGHAISSDSEHTLKGC